MASGAGVNRLPTYGGGILLDNLTTSVTAVAAPTAAYGTLGANDSGAQMTEGIGYSKWRFQLIPLTSTVPVGFAVSLYGTISPNAYLTWSNIIQGIGSTPQPLSGGGRSGAQSLPVAAIGYSNATGQVPGVQPWEWALIEAPSEQTGTGAIANPLTPSSPILTTTVQWVAVRAVLTTVGTAGSVRVVAFAVP